jgi:hypothetical protein
MPYKAVINMHFIILLVQVCIVGNVCNGGGREGVLWSVMAEGYCGL